MTGHHMMEYYVVRAHWEAELPVLGPNNLQDMIT